MSGRFTRFLVWATGTAALMAQEPPCLGFAVFFVFLVLFVVRLPPSRKKESNSCKSQAKC
jgi:hypothetical protein